MNKILKLHRTLTTPQRVLAGLVLVLLAVFLWMAIAGPAQPRAVQNTDNPAAQTSEEPAAYDSESWRRVASPTGGFSIRIPDGWQIESVRDSGWLVAGRGGDAQLAYSEGEDVVVTEVDGLSGSGISRFTVMQTDIAAAEQPAHGTEPAGTIQAGTLSGTKYFKQYPLEPMTQQGPYPGEKAYVYEFRSESGKVTYVFYTILERNEFTAHLLDRSDEDRLELIEEVVRTLEVN